MKSQTIIAIIVGVILAGVFFLVSNPEMLVKIERFIVQFRIDASRNQAATPTPTP